jgi:hypothetical protein
VRGNFTVFFEIDGFVGETTGEKYYSRDEKKKISHVLQSQTNTRTKAIVFYVYTPNLILRDGEFKTDETYSGGFDTTNFAGVGLVPVAGT